MVTRDRTTWQYRPYDSCSAFRDDGEIRLDQRSGRRTTRVSSRKPRRKPRRKITSKDCVRCGLCCVAEADQEEFCDVTADDIERLDRRWAKENVLFSTLFNQFVAVFDGAYAPFPAIRTRWLPVKTGPLKGCDVCACAALRGSVGSRVRCTIYKRRPEVCKDAVVPGDHSCRTLRREYLPTEPETRARAGARPGTQG